jgi:protein-S-isoprenylcysteine O-methyltransferase Ste14
MIAYLSMYGDVAIVVAVFVLYLALWFVKRVELKKSSGVEANVIHTATRPIQKYFGVLEKVMSAGIALILLAHPFLPQALVIRTRLFGEAFGATTTVGIFLALAGLALCRVAQVTIGRSWRVGIDENAKPGLVTNGIYSLIRNPTYSGMYLMCIGVFLVLPTVLISYWIIGFYLMMEFQVRCEEEYLERQYGDDFRAYTKRTKRYIPFLY